MSATVGPLLNGNMPVVHHLHEVHEYEKILKLRDEIFAGSHPRLTVPAHAVQPPSVQSLSQAHLNIPPTYPSSASQNRLANTQPKREEEAARSQTQANGGFTSSTQPASNVSEFDPVLLTKSDDLVRAEIQLKRQRLEKALRDQFEQKRFDARKKPAPAEAKPDFDLQAILAKATDVAKDFSPKDDGSATESVDENSFYSSRAPDSIQDGQSSSGGEEEGEADQPSGPRVSAVMGSPLHTEGDGDASTNVQHLPPQISESAKRTVPADPAIMDLDDEEEEGEYSPPEAMEQYPVQSNVNFEAMQDSRDPRSRPLRRYSELGDNGRRALSPVEANMRINGRQMRTRRVPRPGSPPSPDDSQSLPARKKRKVEKQRKTRRNGGLSPDAFIKEENVSPPPFHDVQPLGSGRLRPVASDRPIVINDDEPTQEVRYMQPPARYVDSPSRPLPRQVEQLMPLSEPRVLSRGSMRPVRDDQDLRRVASLHNMRSEGGRDYGDPYYESPTRVRATSYARLGSPALVESPQQPRDVPVEYDQAPQEVRVVRTPAPVYREVYEDADGGFRYAAEPMPPPPPPPIERIVVDQYGRRFREIIPSERAPMVPRAMSVRRGDGEPIYENYRSPRASSVFVDAVPERSYASDMPPPQVTYRRLGEPARSSAVPGPATREYLDPTQIPRPSSVQIVDRASRQPVYADERTEFREPMRMSSVRPAASRYEESQPVEMFTRGQSVRAAAREGSVFVDDRSRVRQEYLPAEQPRYRAVEPEKRYFDAQGREVITLDGALDGRQRFVERY